METVKLATTYAEFDTDAYYKAYRTTLKSQGNIKENFRFIIYSLHEVFGTGSISGDLLHDVGSGASLVSFLSASRYVKEMHLSDLLPRHRSLLQRWRDGEDRENDIVEYIVGKENDRTSRVERLADLRRKVSKISFIDVTRQSPIEPERQYDVITSQFCLEVATRTVPEFEMSVKNVGNLVKPGGYMVLVGTFGERFYVVGSLKYWNACITEMDLEHALESAGFLWSV